MDTIEMLINEIESEILKAKKATFSQTDIVVNRNVMLELVSRMRASYPSVLKEAVQISKERDDIIAKAEAYANETMDKAEEQARYLISETEIVKQAEQQAARMHQDMIEHCSKLDYEARSMIFHILDDAEKTMKDSINVINDRKRKLIQD